MYAYVIHVPAVLRMTSGRQASSRDSGEQALLQVDRRRVLAAAAVQDGMRACRNGSKCMHTHMHTCMC